MNTPVNIRYFGITLAISATNLTCGLIIATGVPEALHVTMLALFGMLAHWYISVTSIILVGASLLAAAPFAHHLRDIPIVRNFPMIRSMQAPDRSTVLAMAVPQQLLAVLGAISILWAFTSGHFPDGYVPGGGRYFVIVDQLPPLTICFWYMIEYLVAFSETQQ